MRASAVAVLVVIGDRRVFLELLRGFEVKEPDVDRFGKAPKADIGPLRLYFLILTQGLLPSNSIMDGRMDG